METNKVDAATEAPKLSGELFDMFRCVVKAFKNNILERHPTLSAPVVLPYRMDDFPYRIGLLYRHNLSSLIMKRAVQADGEVTSRLIDETFHVRDKARCRDSETCWTHGESPFGSHHIKSLHYGVVIIHRLAHSHKDKIGKVLKLR